MDNVAHALVGAAIGRAGLVRDIDARRGTWIGVISANVADLDLVEATWSGMDAYVLHHRGITHSFVGCVAGSILLTLIFRLRWQDLKMVPILLLCLLG